MTSPTRRRYDNGPRDNKHHVPNYAVCGRDLQPASASCSAALASCDVVDSMLRGRRLDLAAAAAAAADHDDDDDGDDATSSRHKEMTRTAVRPWLLHSCDH